MGADLYIEPMFSNNRKLAEPLFDEACKARDAYAASIPDIVRNVVQSENIGMELSPELEQAKKDYSAEYKTYKGLQDKVEETMQAIYAVGYFRDSYNEGSLFWSMGLSWWQLDKSVPGVYRKKDGNISWRKAIKLRAVVAGLTPKPNYSLWKKESKEEVDKYYAERKERFIAFLDLAIANKTDIVASV